MNSDQSHYFGRLEPLPVLVLPGALSDILSSSTVEGMQAVVPTLGAVEIPNRGHVPLLDEPAALASIDAFLAQLPCIPEQRTPSLSA
jgi:pimeloyl-ACP methyl ester carboxylesterase